MREMIKKTTFILITLFCIIFNFSCEQSLTALANEIADSQPRDDTRWSNIVIVKNTDDDSQIDAAALVSARGIHCFSSIYKGSEAIDPDLKTPRYKNDSKNGLFSRLYIPNNYSSTDAIYKKIIVKTNRTDINEDDNPKYYVFDPSDSASVLVEAQLDISNISGLDEDFGYKQSSSIGSEYFLYRTNSGSPDSPSYSYYLSKLMIESIGGEYTVKLDHTNAIFIYTDPDSDKRNITRIWESETRQYAVLMYINKENQDYRYNCRYATINMLTSEFTPITQINERGSSSRNLQFEHFIVYDDLNNDAEGNSKITWMGFTRNGAIYHSHSTKDTLQVSDGAWTFYRYAPIVKLMVPPNDPGDTNVYGVCLFARYTSNGFLLTRFLKLPNSDNKVLVNYKVSSGASYSNSYTITSGFAQKLRSEEISNFAFLPEAYDGDGLISDQTIIVTTVKVGVSTYRLSNVVPYENRSGSNGTENRDRIILPFKE